MPKKVSIVVAPDSFKGSLNARAVADAMVAGIRATGSDVTIRSIPVADGGEGTLDAVLEAWNGHERWLEVRDALGRPRLARYGLSLESRTAIIEAAEANGLPHVSDGPLQPLVADTRGVGELALAALDAGAREILLCIGGSASTDGGTGLLRALGVEFLDASGRPAPPGGGQLAQIDRIDLSLLDPRARSARWRIAVDVDNPLLGERGAARVFGPQKGATAADIMRLEAGLHHLARTLARQFAVSESDLVHRAGLGAAGGMALTLTALLDCDLVPGSRMVAETVGLDDALASADIVFTGEGSFDVQSLHGKVIDGIRSQVRPGTAVVVVAGRVELTAAQVAAAGVTAALSIARGPAREEDLARSASILVAETTESAYRLLDAARHR